MMRDSEWTQHPDPDALYSGDMAELDYVFLADYASVIEGKITAVGASFTHVRVHTAPSLIAPYLVGRVRTTTDVPEVTVKAVVLPPKDAYRIEHTGQLSAGEDPRPYSDNKLGLLFAMGLKIPIPAPGVYVVELHIEDELARTLKFDVALAE